MEVLSELLRNQIGVRFFNDTITLLARDVSDPAVAAATLLERLRQTPPVSGDLLLLDLRDADPRPFRAYGPVLALDNRHMCRNESNERGIMFHDALPHPDAKLEGTLTNLLLAPELRELRDRTPFAPYPARPRDLLAYSGQSSHVGDLDLFLARYAAAHPEARVKRLGSAPVAVEAAGRAANFERLERLPPGELYEFMLRARVVMSYYGMTFFEGWFAGALPVLFSIDVPVLDELSRDFAGRGGAVFVHPGDIDFEELERRLAGNQDGLLPAVAPPDGRGFERLLERMRNMLQS